MVKLVDTADLKSAACLKGGVPVRFRLEAPDANAAGERAHNCRPEKSGTCMSRYNAPFEIHVHGDVPLRADVTYAQLQDALKPLWTYAGAKSLADGAESAYEEEPGIKFDAHRAPAAHVLDGPGRRGFPPVARRDVHEPQRAGRAGRRDRGHLLRRRVRRGRGSARGRIARRLRHAVRRPDAGGHHAGAARPAGARTWST